MSIAGIKKFQHVVLRKQVIRYVAFVKDLWKTKKQMKRYPAPALKEAWILTGVFVRNVTAMNG